jgi:hypothetical protein
MWSAGTKTPLPGAQRRYPFKERATGLEPATSSLGSETDINE